MQKNIHLILKPKDADLHGWKASLPHRTLNKTVNEILLAETKGKIASLPFEFSSIENAAPLHMTYYYYEFADGVEITYNTYEGKGYESYPGNLYIPSEINGKPVIGISDYAFSGCTRSTVITIPAGVRVIREKAFENCTGIVNVDCYTGGVPETASTAFDNTPITIDTYNGCQLYVRKDYLDQFKNDPLWGKFGYIETRDYDFKTTIDGMTYYYNSIDGGLEIIGMIVGEGISAVSIPSTIGAVPVVSIKGGYFEGLFQSDVEAKQITSLTIPQTVTNVAGDVFSGCTNIEHLYFEGTAVTGSRLLKSANIHKLLPPTLSAAALILRR